MTFEELLHRYRWKPIRNCPGRYVMAAGVSNLSVADLAGATAIVGEFTVPAASDTVLVTRLDHGGIISYHKPDGSLLHTLNTEEGFRRKLADLGIRLP